MDTIVALATAPGRAGVAVIRVSGTLAWDLCEALTGQRPKPRVAMLAALRDRAGEVIDRALVLLFEAGASFTGERVCEFQVHGSTAIIRAVLSACLEFPGVRSAEPGEFTRRAFLGGRLDLAEVEGLADLIDAETEMQRRQAMTVFDGTASRIAEAWREDLAQALAILEASLDFVEDDVPAEVVALVVPHVARVARDLGLQLQGRRAAESVRDGFEVAIVGRVNAGKSSLLNALAGREAAITSERAGTTRDVIEVRMDIGGHAVTVIDTAGLRDTDDEIERLGISRGRDRARAADIRIFLRVDPAEEPEGLVEGDIVVLSKVDVTGRSGGISVVTGQGIDALLQDVRARLDTMTARSSVFSRSRHFDKLTRAKQQLDRALVRLESGELALELVSEDLRTAIHALDGIMGRVEVDDVLGRIFASFCIGK